MPRHTFNIKGVSYTITSACATSAHCIGVAAEQIRWGKQDVMFCGGGEEEHWSLTALFDAMGALSSARNDTPESASRAYDTQRDGFVIAGGGGMIVLESLEHAQARGARIYAELVGYGVTADGQDMVQPSGEGAVRCMRKALENVSRPIDYLNTHGTSTPVGDMIELRAVREVFGADIPPISSTKSLTGHSLGAAGVQEAIYSLLMMRDGFLAGSANIEELDPACADYPILRERASRRRYRHVQQLRLRRHECHARLPALTDEQPPSRCPVAHGHADVMRALLDPATFSSAVSAHLAVPSGIDPPEHTEYRRIIDPYFAPEKMAAVEPELRAIAVEILAGLPASGEVEFCRRLPKALPCGRNARSWAGPRSCTNHCVTGCAEIMPRPGPGTARPWRRWPWNSIATFVTCWTRAATRNGPTSRAS